MCCTALETAPMAVNYLKSKFELFDSVSSHPYTQVYMYACVYWLSFKSLTVMNKTTAKTFFFVFYDNDDEVDYNYYEAVVW